MNITLLIYIIALLIYFILGVVFCFVGPIAKQLKYTREKIELQRLANDLMGKKNKPIWKQRFLLLILYFILAVLWVVFIFVFLISKEKNIDDVDFALSKKVSNSQDKFLILSNKGGGGTVYCNTCGHNKEVIVFYHGFGKYWTKKAFQCQSCGKILHFEQNAPGEKPDKCKCGGELSRELPFFCTKCKSFDVYYKLTSMT